jgi:hypothetical protein
MGAETVYWCDAANEKNSELQQRVNELEEAIRHHKAQYDRDPNYPDRYEYANGVLWAVVGLHKEQK